MLRHTQFSLRNLTWSRRCRRCWGTYKDTANMRGKSCKYKRLGYSYLPQTKLFKINYWIGFLAPWLCRTYVTIWNTLTRKNMYSFETLTLYVHSSGENEAVVSFKKSFLQMCKVQSELTELSPAPGRLKREQKKAFFKILFNSSDRYCSCRRLLVFRWNDDGEVQQQNQQEQGVGCWGCGGGGHVPINFGIPYVGRPE